MQDAIESTPHVSALFDSQTFDPNMNALDAAEVIPILHQISPKSHVRSAANLQGITRRIL